MTHGAENDPRETPTGVPFDPNLPDVTKTDPVRTFQSGEYLMLLYDYENVNPLPNDYSEQRNWSAG
jgi:hypothetical protein